MLKINAHKKPFTINPSNSLAASKTISASITNRNNPSVTMVTGIVRSVNNGLTKTFNRPIIKEIPMADPKLFTSIPGNNQAVRYTANAEIKRFAIKPIIVFFLSVYKISY